MNSEVIRIKTEIGHKTYCQRVKPLTCDLLRNVIQICSLKFPVQHYCCSVDHTFIQDPLASPGQRVKADGYLQAECTKVCFSSKEIKCQIGPFWENKTG